MRCPNVINDFPILANGGGYVKTQRRFYCLAAPVWAMSYNYFRHFAVQFQRLFDITYKLIISHFIAA